MNLGKSNIWIIVSLLLKFLHHKIEHPHVNTSFYQDSMTNAKMPGTQSDEMVMLTELVS